MLLYVISGILLPLAGTALGSGCALLMRKKSANGLDLLLNGFAGGVMTAASVWSLLIPAINQSEGMGKLSFLPAVTGFWLGAAFLFAADKTDSVLLRCLKSRSLSQKTALLVLAVTVHNLPEGMAVGAVYSGLLAGESGVSAGEALVLSLGIAVQNFPEGAIISMPLCSNGMKRFRAFFCGVLSGVVEPVAAAVAIVLSFLVIPFLGCFLGFAAGAMIYAVVAEIMPATAGNIRGTVSFCAGFTIMMILDVALG